MIPSTSGRGGAARSPAPEPPARLRLRSGDLVRIRSEAEILATLDSGGALGGLPFMPEMLAWAGRTVRVASRADKTCDTVEFAGQRRMRDTVHLEDLRCDGAAHGGCQAGCLTFWKEAWLERADGEPPAIPAQPRAPESAPPAAGPTRDDLLAATRIPAPGEGAGGDEEIYSCQATRLREASERLRWYDPRQYVREVRSGNVGPGTALVRTAVYLFNNLQNVSRRLVPRPARLRGGSWYPFVFGKLTSTPRETLDLAAGDVVEVKAKDEIMATLDVQGRNRGMSFDGEMAPYCGQRLKVLRRVERIIDEKTGRMLRFGTDAVILDGAVCTGRYHGMCPRATYPYWREIWLRRVPGEEGADRAEGDERAPARA